MEVHVILRNYLEENFNQFDLLRMECYHSDPKVGERQLTGKYISFDFPKEEYENVSGFSKATIGNLKFTKVAAHKEYTDKIELYFRYEYTDNKDYSQDITEGGRRKYGLICPEGKFYECGYSGHNNLEYELIDRGILNETPESNYDHTEYWGWLKLSGSGFSVVEFLFEFETEVGRSWDVVKKEPKRNQITKAQFLAMQSYIKSLGRTTVNFNFNWYNIDDLNILPTVNNDNKYEILMKLEIDVENEREELYKGN